ncbi:MAG: 50S ribosomal protein L25 [Caulobacteraceae bacterium]
MSESIAYAVERNEKANKTRREGFIPGVLYGKGLEPKSIKFDQKEFIKLLQEHNKSTLISVKIEKEVKQCILKEIQKEPVSRKILNVELQAVHSDDMIRLKVPVVFVGKEELAARQQLLQEYISEVELMGKAGIMPELVNINVGERNVGDKIIVKDIQVETGIKVMTNENEIVAVIAAAKQYDEAS